MIKTFITWLYGRYVVLPEFEEYMNKRSPVVFDRAHPDDVHIAMIEKRFATRVDH